MGYRFDDYLTYWWQTYTKRWNTSSVLFVCKRI